MHSLDKELNKLDTKLALYQNNSSHKIKNNKISALKVAMNCGLEVVSGIIVGVLIGFSLDKFFNLHFFSIIFIIIGFFSGVLNLYRYIKTIKDI